MKINNVLILLVLYPLTSISQSIDLQEDTTVDNLYDSIQGSCAMADINNDGDLDLIITGADAQLTNRKTTLYTNDGMGNFTEVLESPVSITSVKFPIPSLVYNVVLRLVN